MSDDIVMRLRNPHYDSSKTYELACEAADEIRRLRADRDALVAERGPLLEVANGFRTDNAALRALLAEARASLPDMNYTQALVARIDAALAVMGVEIGADLETRALRIIGGLFCVTQERYAALIRAEADADSWEQQASDRVKDWDVMRAERDALRALLTEARACLTSCRWPWPIIADIDAALRDGKP